MFPRKDAPVVGDPSNAGSREPARVLLIACGALAREILEAKRLNDWRALDVQCLPAELHNRPERIPGLVERRIRENAGRYRRILIGYADCGTGGELDRLVEKYGVARIPGAHCYEFFAGRDAFAGLAEREPGTFYLTDYLARNFDRLIVEGMGIEKHPELKAMLFGNYKKVVYLAQSRDAALEDAARRAARFLELEYERADTGLEPFRAALDSMLS